MRRTRVLTAMALGLAAAFTAPAIAEVKGKWFLSPDEALAAAEKERKPILAVAMDHG